MDIDNIRIYAQMRPDKEGLDHLTGLQAELSSVGRVVPKQQLHLTLIHFGKILDVYQVITAASGIKLDAYVRQLQMYITSSQTALPINPIELTPIALTQFGQHGNTLVIEYQSPQVMHEAHAQLLQCLQAFLAACGINAVNEFMANDHNLQYALALRPHITIAKGYNDVLPKLFLKPISVSSMKLIYPSVD